MITTPAKKQRAGAQFTVADIVSAAHPGAGSYSAVARRYRLERNARTWDRNKLRIFAVEEMMRLRGIGRPDPIHAAKEIEKAAIAKWPQLAAPILWKNVIKNALAALSSALDAAVDIETHALATLLVPPQRELLSP